MKDRSGFLREGDQFVLDLFRGEPWDGRSPRGLTRAGKALYLRPEPPRREVLHVTDRDQYDFWRPMGRQEKKAPQQYRGAPSLLPLKGRRSRPRRVLQEEDYHG